MQNGWWIRLMAAGEHELGTVPVCVNVMVGVQYIFVRFQWNSRKRYAHFASYAPLRFNIIRLCGQF